MKPGFWWDWWNCWLYYRLRLFQRTCSIVKWKYWWWCWTSLYFYLFTAPKIYPNKQMWACVPWKNRVLQPSDKIAMKPSPFNWQLTDFFRNTNIFQYSRVWIKKTRVWMRWKSTFIPLLQKELSHHSRSYETCATGTVLFVCCYCQSSSWHSGIDMHKIKHTCLNYTH